MGATLVGPESAPPAGLAPSATVTAPVIGTALPRRSSAVTRGAGAKGAPATAGPGCVEKSRRAARSAATSKATLVAPVRPGAEAVRV